MRRSVLGLLRVAWFAALAVAIVAPHSAGAVLIRNDRGDARYLTEGARFPEVGYVMDQVGGTLIADRWVLAAAHSVEGLSPFSDRYVTFGGRRYPIAKIVIPKERVSEAVDSSADVALIELTEPVAGIAPASLYAKNDESGRLAWIVGRGRTGDPLHPKLAHTDGRIRAGTTVIQAIFQNTLVTVFHRPPQGTDLEAAGGAGDSGGPLMLDVDGHHYVAGISSVTSGVVADGSSSLYETISGYTRVSSWQPWIVATMRDNPPSTVPMWSPLRTADAASLPATPAGIAMRDFVAGLNGDDDALAAFYRAHGSLHSTSTMAERVGQWHDTRKAWGRIEVRAFAVHEPGEIAVAAYSTSAHKWYGILFGTSESYPGRVTGITTGEISPPHIF